MDRASFIAGFNAALSAMRGPLVKRPAHITDAQWVAWYGAIPLKAGGFRAPMSCAHLIPGRRR